MSIKLNYHAIVMGTVCLLVPSTGMSQVTYIYNVGPNIVNQSATSCRATSQANDELYVRRSSGEISVPGNGMPITVICPLQRRNTTFYGVSGTSTLATTLTASGINVYAYDASSTRDLRCATFQKDFSTGSISWGASKVLCSTGVGCTASNPGFTGSNTMFLSFPASSSQTVNYGYSCDLSAGETLYWAEMWVTPN